MRRECKTEEGKDGVEVEARSDRRIGRRSVKWLLGAGLGVWGVYWGWVRVSSAVMSLGVEQPCQVEQRVPPRAGRRFREEENVKEVNPRQIPLYNFHQ